MFGRTNDAAGSLASRGPLADTTALLQSLPLAVRIRGRIALTRLLGIDTKRGQSMTHWMRRSDFFTSERGQGILNASRWMRQLRLEVAGVEPRGKSAMRRQERRAFQASVLAQLKERRRLAYRGSLVLQLRLVTSEKNPSHIHTITKNLVDLLGHPSLDLSEGFGLLYRDDRQISGLSVSCEHGGIEPAISIASRSLGDFREDLEVAARCSDAYGFHGKAHQEAPNGFYGLGELHAERAQWIRAVGEANFQAMVALAQRDLQLEVLGGGGIRAADLHCFYRASALRFTSHSSVLDQLATKREDAFTKDRFRILLEELPERRDTSEAYRERVSHALRELRLRFQSLLTPLRVPLAVEVLIKPPPPSRARALHDLDNVLRRYIIPNVVEIFEPPSNYLWAFERERLEQASVRSAPSLRGRLVSLPKSSAVGVIRFEAWRLPRTPGDDSAGFVSVSLVADAFGHGGPLSEVDGLVTAYTERLT